MASVQCIRYAIMALEFSRFCSQSLSLTPVAINSLVKVCKNMIFLKSIFSIIIMKDCKFCKIFWIKGS